ncbi:MAG: glucosaminidase domain-containing protein [Candidatus Gracilibacteria bacterium]|nr:glucosaminidase domain-containing protein [Candidatus Gracilibacteria bacterium]
MPESIGEIELKKKEALEKKIGKPMFDSIFSGLDPDLESEILKRIDENSQITIDNLKDLMRDMKRSKNRKDQTEELLKSGTVKQKEIMKDKNIESIEASKLLNIENEKSGFISKTFAYKQTKDERGDIIETPLDVADIKENDKIKVDFGKNNSANYRIGAGDLLPTNVKVVKIKDQNGNERVGVRSIGTKSSGITKVGYYDKGGYIPVFSGYTIEIPSLEEQEKIISDLSKDVELSTDENKEKEVKTASIQDTIKDEEREEKIRKFTIEENKPYMENAKSLALQIEKVYGIPWQVTVGQSSLESGWGRSGLSAKFNNYFGIKSFGKGNSVSLATNEYENGNKITIKDGFRVYSDMKESFIDYAKFLTHNPRYFEAFKYGYNLDEKPSYYPSDYIGYDPEKFIDKIAKAGYATDPSYASNVINTWKKFDGLEKNVA